MRMVKVICIYFKFLAPVLLTGEFNTPFAKVTGEEDPFFLTFESKIFKK